jgi:hypothetical protein
LCGDEFDELINESGESVVGIGTGGCACESDPYASYSLLEIGESDLALILAAPDLLAACSGSEKEFAAELRDLANALRESHDDWDGWIDWLNAKADQIEAALKKAGVT